MTLPQLLLMFMSLDFLSGIGGTKAEQHHSKGNGAHTHTRARAQKGRGKRRNTAFSVYVSSPLSLVMNRFLCK